MCNSWQLSVPVGTFFAFTINAEASLAHLNDSEIEATLQVPTHKNRGTGKRTYIGYATKVSSEGLDLVVLASDPYASTPLIISNYPTAEKLNTRQGITVHTSTKASAGVQRTRSKLQSRSRGPNPLPMARSNCQERPPYGIFTTYVSDGITVLQPTGALPWPEAYAYRPILKHTRLHRFTVNSFTAQGAKRPSVRLPRLEAERAEHILNGLQGDEEQIWRENEESLQTFAKLRRLRLGSTHQSASSITSDSQSDSETIEEFGTIGLAIHIDISLDISKVKNLPSSPSSFEAEIAKIEELERMARRKFVRRMDEWRGNVDIDGWHVESER